MSPTAGPTAAVTGMALATALGPGLDATLEALAAGRTGFTPTAATDGLYPGEVKAPAGALADDLPDVPAFGRRRLRALSRESLLVSRLGTLAWQDAGFGADAAPDPQETAVVLGTAAAGLSGYLQVLRDGLTLGPELVSPYAGPQGSLNAAASDLSIAAGAQGSIVTVTAGRCSGAHALTVAADYVATGQAEAVLVAAVDILDPLRLAADGGGAPPGEAAVVFVVEDAGRARARGARVHAEIAAPSTLRGAVDGGAPPARRSARRWPRPVWRPGSCPSSAPPPPAGSRRTPRTARRPRKPLPCGRPSARTCPSSAPSAPSVTARAPPPCSRSR